jgi:hypothetical protein
MMKWRPTKLFSSPWVHPFFSWSFPELELFGRCFLLHLSCHHLKGEYVEVEGMNMLEVEDMNMLEEHKCSLNHWLEEV